MQKAVYFDQGAVLELLKGNKNLLKVIDNALGFYTGAHVIAMLEGAENYMLEKKFWKERKLREVLENLRVLEIDKEAARKAGEIIGKLKAEGLEILLDEAISAALAELHALTLITPSRELAKKLKGIVDVKTV